MIVSAIMKLLKEKEDTVKLQNDINPLGCCAWKWGTRFQVSKGAKIRNRYNQVPHLTQDTNGKTVEILKKIPMSYN